MTFTYNGDIGVAVLSLAICIVGVWALLISISRSRLRDNVASKIAMPFDKEPIRPLSDTSIRRNPIPRNRAPSPPVLELHERHEAARRTGVRSNESLANLVSMTAILGDFLMIVSGFVLANLLCQSVSFPAGFENVPMPSVAKNYRLILFSSLVIFWGLTGGEMYKYRNLISPWKNWNKFVQPLLLCLSALIIFDLAVRIDPPVPWIFFVFAAFFILFNIYAWHMVLSRIVQLPVLSSRLRRRLIVIGGGSQTMKIKKALTTTSDLEFIGWVEAIRPNRVAALNQYRLGSLHELEKILQKNSANMVVLTESESLQREGVLAVAKACENEHVQFKMVPHFFDILVSGLRPDKIGEIHLLGVDSLPLTGHRNRFAKRTVDIAGALIGLVMSAPLILIFGAFVYWESPGPILFKQIRQGRNGKWFYILKIRSMHINAEADGKPKWAQENDTRRLRIGSFIRKWNIDEVPQFWNVLIGEMSLVGPRPERPELIARFKSKYAHYQARHMCRPGMTGWAQVNGWRGNTDLEERIRHDIWYLENWSLWLDFRIMLYTFFRRENAY
jgi:exopolysaccharide biosynthesis polyprenyl glycosylphosphotransferase